MPPAASQTLGECIGRSGALLNLSQDSPLRLLLNRSAVQVQTWPINLEIVGILNCHKSDTTKPLVGQLFNGANGEL